MSHAIDHVQAVVSRLSKGSIKARVRDEIMETTGLELAKLLEAYKNGEVSKDDARFILTQLQELTYRKGIRASMVIYHMTEAFSPTE